MGYVQTKKARNKMKIKLINFFYKHRIIDTHIGIADFHIWIYLLATYFDMHIFTLNISFARHSIFSFSVELNKNRPHLAFEFTLFNKGIDTNRERYRKSDEWYENYKKEQKQKFKELERKMTDKDKEVAKEYCDLHIYK